MILHIDVKNKVATFQKRDGCIVCGNSGYKIEFNFDREWHSVTDKQAVFVVNGDTKYAEIEPYEELDAEAGEVFYKYRCAVPRITHADKVVVGVHSESAEMTTTGTEIPCKKSILCT